MNAPHFTPSARLAERPNDGLNFVFAISGCLRAVFLRRSTLDQWTPVRDEPAGMLLAYDEHRHAIRRAVHRRLAMIGDEVVDEVQLVDFIDGLVAEDAAVPVCSAVLSPIYCPGADALTPVPRR